MKKTIYVVIAYRWGDSSRHSYTVGAFSDKEKAIKCADFETEYRGLKYECTVEECVVDKYKNGLGVNTKELYRTKSALR